MLYRFLQSRGTRSDLADITDERVGQSWITGPVGDEQAVIVQTQQVLIPRHQVHLCPPLQTETRSAGFLQRMGE